MIQLIRTGKVLLRLPMALMALIESLMPVANKTSRRGHGVSLAGRGGLVRRIVNLTARRAPGRCVRVPLGMITGVCNG